MTAENIPDIPFRILSEGLLPGTLIPETVPWFQSENFVSRILRSSHVGDVLIIEARGEKLGMLMNNGLYGIYVCVERVLNPGVVVWTNQIPELDPVNLAAERTIQSKDISLVTRIRGEEFIKEATDGRLKRGQEATVLHLLRMQFFKFRIEGYLWGIVSGRKRNGQRVWIPEDDILPPAK